MATYPAYKFFYADDDDAAPFAIVWWNGKNMKSTDETMLRRVKDRVVDGLDYSAGKEFFDKIPVMYRSGYVYTRKTNVDDNGNEV